MAEIRPTAESLDTFLSTLSDTFEALQLNADKVFALEWQVREAREIITGKISKAVESGEINGSNDDKRKAQGQILFAADYKVKNDLELQLLQVNNDMQAASRKLDYLKVVLRVYEILAEQSTFASINGGSLPEV